METPSPGEKQTPKCKKCGSERLYPFRSQYYHCVRCLDCTHVFKGGLRQLVTSSAEERMVMTPFGPQPMHDTKPNVVSAATKRLEHEGQGFRNPDRNVLPGDDE